jgi:ATP/maltotriose-dependent transcriptional regulator MalT
MVAQDLNQLARLALRQHEPARAVMLAEAALPIASEAYGPESSYVGSLLHTLALARLRSGDAEEALTVARRGVDIRRRISGEGSLDAAVSRAVVVMALEAAGRTDEALAELGAMRASAADRWGDLIEPTRARLEALHLHHGEADPATRCSGLATLREPLSDPTAVAVAGLYLAACRMASGDAQGAREVLATIEPQRLAQLAGDPALAQLRAIAEDRSTVHPRPAVDAPRGRK